MYRLEHRADLTRRVQQALMAAAKALLTAAGLLAPKKSTATELAFSSSRPDLGLPLTGLPMSTSKLQASASEDSFLLGNNDLEKIVALLLWMAQDFQSNIHIDDIHYAALEVIITGGTIGSLHTASVAKLSELIDIMMLHKDGSPKDANATLTFMRRLAKIREKLRPPWRDHATERVELDKTEVSLCYQLFGRILLTDDLLPHQMGDKRYRLRNDFVGDTYLSTFQRSFTDNMLRKFLGDKRVAFLIWQHGIPSIADRPLSRRRPVPDMGMLQSGLDECLQWYACLANDIAVHQLSLIHI